MSTLKVNTVESATTPTVLISDGLSVSGVSTLTGGLKVGTAITMSDNGNFGITGIMTASNFVGGGANLTGIGGFTQISATTVSSDVSAVTFTEALTGAFDTYKIYVVMIDGMRFDADDRDLRLRYRTGTNGASLASGSDYHSMTNGADSADSAFSAASFWRMNYNNISNVVASDYIKGDFNATIYFQGFEANRRLRYYGMTSYQSADGDDRGQFISGMATDATEATGLEFFSSSGNIALGKFSLFGVNG